jgi:cystathionine beta-lyase
VLKRLGVHVSYYDPLIGEIARLFQPNTKAVLTEAPGSQTFEMQDIPAIAEAAHRHGALVLMDNTWATPLLFPPHERGVDIAIEAGTNISAAIRISCWAWFPPMLAPGQGCAETFDDFAVGPGPETVFLALRGLRTMALRLREHEVKALALAQWLESQPQIKQVLHPALESHPGHAIWKRDFKGSSGLFSIILQPAPTRAVDALLDGLTLFGMGYSWGGYESLIVPFDCSSYRTATTFAPGGPALRLQIGLEDVADLKADLEAGLARLRAAM